MLRKRLSLLRTSYQTGLLLCALLSTSVFSNAADFGTIQLAHDLQQDGQHAQAEKKPIVLFVTASYCSFCETLREEIFQFLPKDPRFILREIVIDHDTTVTHFDGSVSSHSQLSRQLNAPLTPTVLFVDGNGKPIAESLVGVLTLDFYNFYFEENLTAASKVLQHKALQQ